MSQSNESRPEEIEGVELVEAYEFLDDLRESGETNMFGAGAYLEGAFNLSKGGARTILVAWMEDFSTYGSSA